jgi:ligand-binding SRPBCC domain-containing protein
VPRILLRTTIHAPAEACFDLSLSVDAHTASMGSSGERAVAGVTRGVMGPGDTVTWQARHFGVRFRMTSAITAYERPHRFVDEQQRGPFGAWWHEHRFALREDGSTEMTDVVVYRSPFGLLGRAVDALVLQRYVTRLLQTRNAWLRAELEQQEQGRT